ncbi:MAG TPA: phosphate propanoyltransferase [Armatimonadetes bacterium]|nr:phosphate propanoyltransferase [Armatimonadota bacterium]
MRISEADLVRLITREVLAELSARARVPTPRREPIPDTIPIGVSVRHVHLCQEHLDQLYGEGYELSIRNELYQPGAYAANETVTLVTPRRVLHNVRILLPLRPHSQVELARSDAIYLGIDPPVRLSGDIAGSAGIVMVGPAGAVDLKEGVIIAARHVHMNPEEAAHFGVQDRDEVEVEISGMRALVFRHVIVRVSDEARLELHLDTDEANAANVICGVTARIIAKANVP